MNKQAEVRQILEGVSTGGLSVGEGIRELGIVGCVIKVDRELPELYPWDIDTPMEQSAHEAQQDMLKAGFGAFDPLIEEKLKEETLLEEYKEAIACGSTNMGFKTWCWCRESNTTATITLNLDRPNSREDK